MGVRKHILITSTRGCWVNPCHSEDVEDRKDNTNWLETICCREEYFSNGPFSTKITSIQDVNEPFVIILSKVL